MANLQPGFDTLALHAGQSADSATGSRAVPIYQTTAYEFNSVEHAANLFALKESGNIYTRIMNPTTDVLEQRLNALEGGVGALAVASGQAAIMLAVLNIASSGDNLVSTSYLYGGTYNLFNYTLARLGIEVRFVDSSDPDAFAAVADDRTRLFYMESIGNPKNNVNDLGAIADLAHACGVPLVIDNTVATPYLLRPFEHGADIAVHSLTKFVGGHGTSMGGAIVDSGHFDWKTGKFPELSEPDPSYHGVRYAHDCGDAGYITRARVQLLRDMGPAISPFNSFLILQGAETLSLRMARHCENAQKVADFLAGHPLVSWVNYPGLPNHPDYERACKYLPKGKGALVGFGIKGGKPAGIRFIDSTKLLSHVANIGDAKSLVIHPASTTHQQLTPAQQIATGVTEDFIRLSIGLEDAADILADIAQALEASQA